MTAPDSDPVLEMLKEPGAQARVIRIVEAITGERMPHYTVSRWARSDRRPNSAVYALLAVVQDPARLQDALEQHPCPNRSYFARPRNFPECCARGTT